MSKPISPLIWVGGAAAVYFLFLRPTTPAVPGASTSLLSTLLPGAASSAVGINSGVKGGNGSFYTCSNYAQLLAANPNLGNPNYQLSAAEQSQYMANYSDLQTGIPPTVGKKGSQGQTLSTLAIAIQYHWNQNGCGEKRIFLPLQPPSTAAYIPPPPVAKAASGGSFLSSALGIATSVVPYVAMLAGPYNSPQLNDGEVQLLFTAGAIINQILPLYASSDIVQVNRIDQALNDLLTQYV
jgi:hypothetical protein